MTDDAESTRSSSLGEENLAFFGAVTASVSHELNNVISIIDQSAGLMEDLVAGARAGRPLSEEKVGQIAESVQRQTQRGLGIIRRLNRFAHSADQGQTGCDLNETLLNFGTICTRWADMKRVKLTVEPSANPVMFMISPFLLQHWLYLVVKQFLAASTPGAEIVLTVVHEETDLFITVTGSGLFTFDEVDETMTEELLRKALGSFVRVVAAEDKMKYSLHFYLQSHKS